MNQQMNSLNNLNKYKTVRNTGSNYMHRRKGSKAIQNNALNAGQQVSVRQYLKTQFGNQN